VITGNTTGKSIPREWLETDKFVYLNAYFDGGNTTLHFYYDKAARQLYRIAPPDSSSVYMVFGGQSSSTGEGLDVTFTKSRLEKFLETEQFGALPSAEQEKIADLAGQMTSSELIVMMLR
jgi:hypothetical protein